MEIRILHLLDGARQAAGLTVVIDVFRAFSVAAYAFGAGVEKIYPVAELEKVWKMKKENPEYILLGERHEKKVAGFDFGNSPSHILKADLAGKSLIHSTSAGTQGLVNAFHSGHVITGAFVNAGAIVKYIRSLNPELVSLVCMGYSMLHPVEEDTFCATYIKNELEGKANDFEDMKAIIRRTSGTRFFEESKQAWAPSVDFVLCMNLNRFDFVLKAEKENENIFLKKIDTSHLV